MLYVTKSAVLDCDLCFTVRNNLSSTSKSFRYANPKDVCLHVPTTFTCYILSTQSSDREIVIAGLDDKLGRLRFAAK